MWNRVAAWVEVAQVADGDSTSWSRSATVGLGTVRLSDLVPPCSPPLLHRLFPDKLRPSSPPYLAGHLKESVYVMVTLPRNDWCSRNSGDWLFPLCRPAHLAGNAQAPGDRHLSWRQGYRKLSLAGKG